MYVEVIYDISFIKYTDYSTERSLIPYVPPKYQKYGLAASFFLMGVLGIYSFSERNRAEARKKSKEELRYVC